MEFEIIITAYVEDPEYLDKKREWKDSRQYGNYNCTDGQPPERMRQVRRLETRITEKQFEAVRKALVEVL